MHILLTLVNPMSPVFTVEYTALPCVDMTPICDDILTILPHPNQNDEFTRLFSKLTELNAHCQLAKGWVCVIKHKL